MAESTIQSFSYPLTEQPPEFADQLAAVFEEHEPMIGTEDRKNGLKSDAVLRKLRPDPRDLGFNV
jgi:hypothetical protein